MSTNLLLLHQYIQTFNLFLRFLRNLDLGIFKVCTLASIMQLHIWKTTEENFLSVPASVIFFVPATLSVAIEVRYYVCTHISYVYLYNMNIFSCDVSIALSS